MTDTPTQDVTLDRLSTEPLFTQVEKSLNSAIETGRFLPGEQIPTEPELAEMYGVSRITIRRAISELCQHGILVKRQGKGTFVQERKMSRKIEHITSFTESCKASGMTPTAAVMRREVLRSLPSEIPGRPELQNGRILYIKRIHYADGAPVMIENNYYPLPRYEFLMPEPLEGSLFETLAEHGVEIGGSENSYIDAIGATSEQASLLSILVGEPLFMFYREMLDEQGELIYVGLQHIVASRYRFAYDVK
jgi:GntR family transcriptional regulator